MSNKKTVSKNAGAVAMAGMVLAASIMAAIALTPAVASAQEVERKERLERKVDRLQDLLASRPGIHAAFGTGVATDQETGENFRSGFRFLLQKVNGTENEYEPRRGMIGLLVDGERVYYTAIPQTWNVILSEDGLTFEASGKVENGDEVFEVNLDGYFGMHTRLGNLWSIHGEMGGRESQYDLHYLGISHGIRAASVEEEIQ